MQSSYQRRLREIKYLQQQTKRLKEVIVDLVEFLLENDLRLPTIPLRGVDGDEFLSELDTGEFFHQVYQIVAENPRPCGGG